MVRQISVSTPNTSSTPDDASELGRWLTRELRFKGAPLASPPPSEQSGAPQRERNSLAGWLARDLVPKHAVRPLASRSVPPSEAPAQRREPFLKEVSFTDAAPPAREPARAATALLEAPSTGDAQPLHGRSTQRFAAFPDEVPPSKEMAFSAANAAPSWSEPPSQREAPLQTEAPPASVVLAPSPAPSALALGLEEDDLAVLPGRRRSSGSRRAKLALGLLLGLLLVGIVLVTQLNQGPTDPLDVTASDTPPSDGVLLPPPPTSDVPLPVPEPERAAAVRRAGSGPSEPEGLMDPRDPRFVNGGPNVRRYADVPSPTLSRLAREQRRLARERDEAARAAKAAKP
jgi:hypothetical protein